MNKSTHYEELFPGSVGCCSLYPLSSGAHTAVLMLLASSTFGGAPATCTEDERTLWA